MAFQANSDFAAKRSWIRTVLVLLGGVAIAAGGAYAFIAGGLSSDEEKARLTHTITRADLKVSIVEQGTLESSDNDEIKCKVRGFSTVNWVIKGGSVVRKGDILVRLDTKIIEEHYSLTKTNTHTATATLARTEADVKKAEIAIGAYLEGRYRAQLQQLEKEVELADLRLDTAKKILGNTEALFRGGYVNKLQVDGKKFIVNEAELDMRVKKTQIQVLNTFTKEMELESLRGNLAAAQLKLEADKAGLRMELARQKRALEELESCVIRAERPGLVIYPSAAAWKGAPDIDVGATVRRDQVLLLMPDLTKMQVKVGVHESIVDRVEPHLPTRVTLPDRVLDADVSTVANVTQPAGWWTGNVVRYSTVIDLPPDEGLKPGMSAEVEIIVEEHKDVLTIPVAAVVETDQGDFCWIEIDPDGPPKRRTIELGDSNDVFIVVKSGLDEGTKVVLNPLDHIDEAQAQAMRSLADPGQTSDTSASEPPAGGEDND